MRYKHSCINSKTHFTSSRSSTIVSNLQFQQGRRYHIFNKRNNNNNNNNNNYKSFYQHTNNSFCKYPSIHLSIKYHYSESLINKKYLQEPELTNVDINSPKNVAIALADLSKRYISNGNNEEASDIITKALDETEKYLESNKNEQEAFVLKAQLQLRLIFIMLNLNENRDNIYSNLCKLLYTCETAPNPNDYSIANILIQVIDVLLNNEFSHFNNLPVDQFVQSKMELFQNAFKENHEEQLLIAKCLLGVSQIQNDQIKQGMDTIISTINSSRKLLESSSISHDIHFELIGRLVYVLSYAIQNTNNEKLYPLLFENYTKFKKEELSLLLQYNKLDTGELAERHDIFGLECLQQKYFTLAFEMLQHALKLYQQYGESYQGQLNQQILIRQGFCAVGLGLSSIYQFDQAATSVPKEDIQGEIENTNTLKQRTMDQMIRTEECLQWYLTVSNDAIHLNQDSLNMLTNVNICHAWVHSLLAKMYDIPGKYEPAGQHHLEAYQQCEKISKQMKHAGVSQNVLFRSALHHVLTSYAKHFHGQGEEEFEVKLWDKAKNNLQDLINILERLQGGSNNSTSKVLNIGEVETLTYMALGVPTNRNKAYELLRQIFM